MGRLRGVAKRPTPRAALPPSQLPKAPKRESKVGRSIYYDEKKSRKGTTKREEKKRKLIKYEKFFISFLVIVPAYAAKPTR